ncbi:aminotransferase class I/II-fold pyridoxal phosphate-dependent enzyme [Weissella halotolerans]|uniref:Aminotransferase n=1 Tax=Weissella halotolerans DSM 20190 TaxID=1123500 RepID=A0A0R2G708_9LACO|nr:aminotransferase class I/II-fold pyridoxal phosphate-dependent enzyme [Weissella halotolerans]KRN33223.1 aspartate tyrosine aromatic aminotransferase [Weissella halotolerans DSM 20190]
MPVSKPSLLNHRNHFLKSVAPNEIRAFDDTFSQIPDIIKLTLGEPDFNVPAPIKEAVNHCVAADDSHYAPATGSSDLRTAAEHFLADRYHLNYRAKDEITITIGVTEGIYASLTALTNPGDRVLIPSPTFPLYASVAALNGAEPIFIDTSQTDFLLTPAALKKALARYGSNLTTLILNYPGNPTGAIYQPAQLQALADILKDTDITVIADEIYSELTYDQSHTSIASYLPEQTLILNGVSKSHAMTGYRIGFIAGPADLLQPVNLVHALSVTAASNPAMAGAAFALASEEGQQATLLMRKAYQNRRDYLLPKLRQLGFTVANPAGAFYLFAKIPVRFGDDDAAFAQLLAQEGKVTVIPGHTFGPGGKGYIRLSYATSMHQLQTAVARLTDFLNQH